MRRPIHYHDEGKEKLRLLWAMQRSMLSVAIVQYVGVALPYLRSKTSSTQHDASLMSQSATYLGGFGASVNVPLLDFKISAGVGARTICRYR